MNSEEQAIVESSQADPKRLLEVDPSTIKSAVVRHLIEEVKAGEEVSNYNRMHSRHNRSR